MIATLKDAPAGTCAYCACTEDAACPGGCSWSNEAQTICSSCADAIEVAIELVGLLGIVASDPKAKLRIATPKWDALTLDQQRVLLATIRASVDGIRAAVQEAMASDVVEAAIEMNIISNFLLEKCADRIGADDSVSDVVMRLLEPHVGSRIVLSGGGGV